MLALDYSTYRMFENIAKTLLPNWRIQAIFNLDVFQKTGFPIRIQNNLELRTLIDTMQEERFIPLMEEFGGLTKDELGAYIDALEQNVKFQMMMFPSRSPLPPFDAMLHSLLIYSRISKLYPGFKRVMEIGPGCGYNNFFLKNHAELTNYSFTDACESFYILQNFVASFCYGDKFAQQLQIDTAFEQININGKIGKTDITFAKIDDHSCNIDVDKNIVCKQYPWWKLGSLKNSEDKFDVIMSNSNLMEFTKGALYYYLELINQKLDDNGFFVAIGSGYYAKQEEMDELGNLLYDAGFAPLMMVQGVADEYDTDAIEDFIEDCEEVIFAPFSEKVKKFIVINQNGMLVNKKITIVDDFVSSNNGFSFCNFVTSEHILQSRGNKKAIIATFTGSIRNKFLDLFTTNNISAIDLDLNIKNKHRFCMWNGVFVSSRHPLYSKYSSKSFFAEQSFMADEICIKNSFLSRPSDRVDYTKDEIKKILEKRFC
jgi:hypothetical protein